MSSNLRIEKVCEQCNKIFIARTTVTKYCGDNCSKRAYKARIRAEKLDKAMQETQQKKIELSLSEDFSIIKAKEYLSVKEVAVLLGASKHTIYRMIDSGRLKASNLMERKTMIRRIDLDALFVKQEDFGHSKNEEQQEAYKIEDCMTLVEAQSAFGVSEAALNQIIKRMNIPKQKRGIYSYVPKIKLIEIFGQPAIH